MTNRQFAEDIGYDELGMPRHEIGCLDTLASLADVGPFAGVVEVLQNEFGKARENRVAAEKALEIAGSLFPTLAQRAIQMTLAACYEVVNDRGRVANRALGRGVLPEAPSTPAC